MLEIKDMIIGGIGIVAVGGTVFNTVSNHKMKKRLDKDEQVLNYLASIHQPTQPQVAPQPTPQPAPQQAVVPQQ